MKTKHTIDAASLRRPDGGGYGGVQSHDSTLEVHAGEKLLLKTRLGFAVRACNAHAELVAVLEGAAGALEEYPKAVDLSDAVNVRFRNGDAGLAELDIAHSRLETAHAQARHALTAARAALEKAGRGVEGGGE